MKPPHFYIVSSSERLVGSSHCRGLMVTQLLGMSVINFQLLFSILFSFLKLVKFILSLFETLKFFVVLPHKKCCVFVQWAVELTLWYGLPLLRFLPVVLPHKKWCVLIQWAVELTFWYGLPLVRLQLSLPYGMACLLCVSTGGTPT